MSDGKCSPSAFRPQKGEDLDAFLARTEELGIAPSLRRVAWSMDEQLDVIVAWWNELLAHHGVDRER